MSIIMTVSGAIGLVTSFACERTYLISHFYALKYPPENLRAFITISVGWLYGRANRHIIATVLFVIMSATLFAIPYTNNLTVFATLFTILGIAGGGWGTAQAVWVP